MIEQQISLVQKYIFDRKGIRVNINFPNTPERTRLLQIAYNYAINWYK